jgi:SAM-dependent methyltransferase
LETTRDKSISLGHPSYVWRFGQDRRLDLIRRFVPLEGKRILDVGCGVGMYVQKLLAFSSTVFGVDIDLEKARDARKRCELITVAPAEALPFPEGTFDVILLHEVIEHVADDAQALKEAHRLAKDGGTLVVFAPNRLYPFETHGFYLFGRYFYRLIPLVNYLPDPLRRRFCPHVRAYLGRDLHRLFKDLPGRYLAFTQIYPGYDKIAGRWPRLARILRGFTYLLEGTPLRVFGLSHFVVLQKEEAHRERRWQV